MVVILDKTEDRHCIKYFWSLTALWNNENGRNYFNTDLLVYIIKYCRVWYNFKLSCTVNTNWTSGGTVIDIQFLDLIPVSQTVLKMENIEHGHLNGKMANKLISNKTGYI